MSHADAAHAHDSHAQDSHGSHGHAAPVQDDGTADGPLGWPLALIVGVGYLAGALYAIFAH